VRMGPLRRRASRSEGGRSEGTVSPSEGTVGRSEGTVGRSEGTVSRSEGGRSEGGRSEGTVSRRDRRTSDHSVRRSWLQIGGAVAVLAVTLSACSGNGPGPSAASTPPAKPGASSPPSDTPQQTRPNAAQRAAEAVQGAAAQPTAAQLDALHAQAGEIAKLSPRQMAGQRVIYSYNGLSAPAGLLSLIRHGDVGGVIFFSFNISSEAQIRRVISRMTAANASPQNPARKYPLLLVTDQEGGQVRRMPWAGPQESEAQIGQAANPAAQAAAAGTQAATALRAVGMNANLAPVLDVYRQPGDFDDQFQRSYSTDPNVVAQAGAAFVRAQQAGGVAATVKHFPGLGAAAAGEDTDERPVTIDLPAGTLRNVDEMPYTAAIRAGAKLAMVSWAVYPALTGRLPAGLSPAAVQGALEGRLGFNGVTITDALGAGALRAYGSLPNKTMLAARAGMDALLCTATRPLPGGECVAGLQDGYATGALPKTAFEAQLAQLLQLRAGLAS
jgi:beta-N-acetylhexosaminidase